MYFSSMVDIPDEAGKIIIKSNKYVLYETGRKYNPEKQYNIPQRVTIGKNCAGQDGKMWRNALSRKGTAT